MQKAAVSKGRWAAVMVFFHLFLSTSHRRNTRGNCAGVITPAAQHSGMRGTMRKDWIIFIVWRMQEVRFLFLLFILVMALRVRFTQCMSCIIDLTSKPHMRQTRNAATKEMIELPTGLDTFLIVFLLVNLCLSQNVLQSVHWDVERERRHFEWAEKAQKNQSSYGGHGGVNIWSPGRWSGIGTDLCYGGRVGV